MSEEIKPISEFWKNKSKKDGYQHRCIECILIDQKNNKEKIAKKKSEYRKNKLKNDQEYRLKENVRKRVLIAIKRQYSEKAYSTIELLGCTIQEVRKHLENQFTKGMNWDNHGKFGWHIDHKTPCASFDLTDPEQQKKCFHYTNLQPLWWQDNIKKRDKIIPPS
ncbi:hypothetical protein KAR91_02175 [Candidatus Pacearchaeota archaeon]|nr:hypothetical protein [Candidatus Pacearchaeota archaeon]